MSETIATIRNLKMFNRLNKSIKQGITDLQNKDVESAYSYFGLAIKTAQKLDKTVEEAYRPYFKNIVYGLEEYLEKKDEALIVSTNPSSVHSQLWTVHKKICDELDIPYHEDVDDMENAIQELADSGRFE